MSRTEKLKRYGDDPNYGSAAFSNRVDWISTMHANLTADATREFMVRLIGLLEVDVTDSQFEIRVLSVLKAMEV